MWGASSANPPGPRSGGLGSAHITGLHTDDGWPGASEATPEGSALDLLVIEDVGVAVTLTTMDIGGSPLKREVLEPTVFSRLVIVERR